jgi:hypothetical protein
MRVNAHTLIAEKALGRALPKDAEIHHLDGNGKNNSRSNLVICPDHAYHALLHKRTKALDACGNANWLKCVLCHRWDAPENLRGGIPKDQTSLRAYHRECNTLYKRKQYAKKKCALS